MDSWIPSGGQEIYVRLPHLVLPQSIQCLDVNVKTN
jgi:hypothetical protein